jgi:hypothetical protein
MNQTNTKTLITFSIIWLLINISTISFGMQNHEITKIIAKINNQYYLFDESYFDPSSSKVFDDREISFKTPNNYNLMITNLKTKDQETVTIPHIYTTMIDKKTLNNDPSDNPNIVAKRCSKKFSNLFPSLQQISSNPTSTINFQGNNLTLLLRSFLLQEGFDINTIPISLMDKHNNLFDVEIAATWSDYVYTIGMPLTLLVLVAAYYFVKMR